MTLELIQITDTDSQKYISMKLENVSCLRFSNIIRLSLSDNQISSLRGFQYFHNLIDLDLSDNDIGDFNQLFYLRNIQNLRQIRFKHKRDNPICLDLMYETKVLKLLDQVNYIDGMEQITHFILKAFMFQFPVKIPKDLNFKALNFLQFGEITVYEDQEFDIDQFENFAEYFSLEIAKMRDDYPKQMRDIWTQVQRLRVDLKRTTDLFAQSNSWLRDSFDSITKFVGTFLL